MITVLPSEISRRFTDMTEDIFWNKFAKSGSVESYLEYLAHKENKENDNSRGNRS